MTLAEQPLTTDDTTESAPATSSSDPFDGVAAPIDRETDAPEDDDPAIDAALFTPEQVSRASWQMSSMVWLLLALGGLAFLLAVLGLSRLSPEVTAEYQAVAAGGLMALAGIVPAVLAAVASGRPVTRLDGGRLLLRGVAGGIVTGYCVVWTVAFAFPLLALVEAWAWLETPTGVGVGVGLLVLTTVGTPIVFLVLASRLHPGTSTLLAVGRALRAHGGPEAGSVRAATTLVKDLRDLAMSEHKDGDRRAVRYRMAGLASIAAETTSEKVALLALEELGLVCQELVKDRDLTREGLALLDLVAGRLPARSTQLLGRVVQESVDVWKAAQVENASPKVTEEAVLTAIAASLRSGPVPLPALKPLLLGMAEATGSHHLLATAHIRLVDDMVGVVRLPATSPVAGAWVEARSRLGADGLRPLVERLSLSNPDSKSGRAVLSAAARLMLLHTKDLSPSPHLRRVIESLVAAGEARSLIRVAQYALHVDVPVSDRSRGVLLAELLRTWPEMGADVESWTDAVTTIQNQVLVDRCAPALVPRVESVLSTHLQKDLPDLPQGMQLALVETVTRLRSADSARTVPLLDTEKRLEPLFARLVHACVRGALTGPAALELRKSSAGLVLKQESSVEAAVLARPVMPALLTGDGDYPLAWALWWAELPEDDRAADDDPAWVTSMALALLAVAERASQREPAAPLALSDGAAHADREWTSGEAADAAVGAVTDLLATASSGALTSTLREIQRWVQGRPSAADPDVASARAALTLDVLPAGQDADARGLVLLSHRLALRMRTTSLWPAEPGTGSPDAARVAAAADLLRSAGPIATAPDALSRQVLQDLVTAWWPGTANATGAVDPAVAEVVAQLVATSPPIRRFVRTGILRGQARPTLIRPLIHCFAADPCVLARMAERLAKQNSAALADVVAELRRCLSDRSILRSRDRDLAETARSLARLQGILRPAHPSRDDVGELMALLAEHGARPGVPGGAHAAAEHLGRTAPKDSPETSFGASGSSRPPVPPPRPGQSGARHRAEDSPPS
ncbi:hypothetical protein SAMN05660485_03292 [Blastococcus fimeti]|nr:hypothetical protein SAMN05660485_03292 [Blastococcus fimeti]